MRLVLTLGALAALAACGPQQSTVPESNIAAAAEAKPAKAEVPSLEGEWRVTRIDGRDAAGPGMVASLDGGKARLSSGCVRRAWTYRQDRNMVSFSAFPADSTNCDGVPSIEAETAYAAVDKANMVIFAKDGTRADLSGLGGSLTLERR